MREARRGDTRQAFSSELRCVSGSRAARRGTWTSSPVVGTNKTHHDLWMLGMGHSAGSVTVRRRCCGRSPLCHWPESFVVTHRAVATFTMGGSAVLHFSECWATKRSWVPESFRGSCSFGGQRAGSLPLIAKVNLHWFRAEVCWSDAYSRCGRYRPVSGVGIQHRDARANRHPTVQVYDVLVEQPDAPA